MLPAAFVVLLFYFGLVVLFKNIKKDPTKIFLSYWPWLILLCAALAAAWTLWFHLITVYAYKDEMIIKKPGRKWKIAYSSVISFDLTRSVLIFIPEPLQKTVISKGKGKINRLKTCNLLSKEDFIRLHRICNAARPERQDVPLRKNTTFHV